MTRQLVFTNAQGESYAFHNILKINGLDSVSSKDVSAASSGQDGATYAGTYLGTRDMEISFDILADSPKQMAEAKRSLGNRLSPKMGAGSLLHSFCGMETEISCVPQGLQFSKINTRWCTVLARFKAYDPYFSDTTDTIVPLTFVRHMLIFPVTFPAIFGAYINRETICNAGDAPAPVRIRFHGLVVNPSFRNLTTGETIRVAGTVAEDEILEINTAFGIKSVTIIKNGARENAFSRLDPDSSLWQLPCGDSIIEYTADKEGMGGHGEIIYRNQYITI